MTSYGAYDRHLPCKNESCGSYGHPHPNCKCYGNFAEGGEVKSFCDSNRTHDEDCIYNSKTNDSEHHGDAVCGYLMHHGLGGILKMKPSDDLNRYNLDVKRGHHKLKKEMSALFDKGSHDSPDVENSINKINSWIDAGGINNDIKEELYKHHGIQNFADGGPVAAAPGGVLGTSPIEKVYPSQNIMMQTIKGRVSNYLNGLKPNKFVPKLPFDAEPEQSQQEKSYKSATNAAAHPLGILKKISDGTIKQDDISHLNNMYPELGERLRKKMNEKIIEEQLKNNKPNYKLRSGMSMFMGAPLSSEMTPQCIQAAQATFAAQRPQTDNQSPPQKKTSALAKSSQSLLTADQASATRQQKQ